jgi:hypothetical protein
MSLFDQTKPHSNPCENSFMLTTLTFLPFKLFTEILSCSCGKKFDYMIFFFGKWGGVLQQGLGTHTHTHLVFMANSHQAWAMRNVQVVYGHPSSSP